jgi:hypothetical protein
MLELGATTTASKQELEVAYTVRNGGSQTAFLFALARDGRGRCHPHAAYRSLTEACRALHLHLGECPVPAGVSLEAKVMPFAYRVEPGQVHSDRLRVTLPAREWDAYHGPEYAEDQCKTYQVQKLILTIEYVLEGDTFFVQKAASQEYFRTDGYPVARLRSECRLAEPIPVLRRTDEFPGF